MNRRSLIVLGALGALGLAACGSDSPSSPATTDAVVVSTTTSAGSMPMDSTMPMQSMPMDGSAPTEDAGAEHNDADVEFAQGMIPHHQQAVEMADIALDPSVGASAHVVDLATRIKAAQAPEIEMMSGWLNTWAAPMTMDTSTGHDMGGMNGMMSAADMDALKAAKGAEFDTMWLTMMIEHHTGAIAMAEAEKANGMSADALTLAQAIIDAQQAEIAEMNGLLAG